MFNKRHKDHIKRLYAEQEKLDALIRRAVRVLELEAPKDSIDRFNAYGSMWCVSDRNILAYHLDEIEKARLERIGYEKIADIVRDLVKRQSLKEGV